MNARMFAARVALPVLAVVAVSAQARAADFDWKKFQGKTVTFLANNNPVSQALLTYKADFEKLTGMTLKVDGYQEQQMRQRLVTVMNARSDEVDVFMTLPSREGEQFAVAGWYADLSAMSKNDGGNGLRSCRPEPGAAQGGDVQRQADQHAHEHRGADPLLSHRHPQEMRRREAGDHQGARSRGAKDQGVRLLPSRRSSRAG